jgi:hypothetical protein
MIHSVLLAVAQELPAGNPITFTGIDSFVGYMLRFIQDLAATAMILSVTISGILMLSSRGDPKKFESARAMLKTAVYGSAVILGASFIINLLRVTFTAGSFRLEPITDLITYIVSTLGNWIVGIAGTFMVLSIVINGIQMLTSGQDAAKFTKARGALINSIYGSGVILGAGLIINLITSLFKQGSGTLSLTPILAFFTTILADIGDFVIGLSTAVMVTFVVISGMMMITAGQDAAKFQKARKMLINVIWGCAVIIGVGVILNTVNALVTGDFFCRLSVSTPWVGVCLWN